MANFAIRVLHLMRGYCYRVFLSSNCMVLRGIMLGKGVPEECTIHTHKHTHMWRLGPTTVLEVTTATRQHLCVDFHVYISTSKCTRFSAPKAAQIPSVSHIVHLSLGWIASMILSVTHLNSFTVPSQFSVCVCVCLCVCVFVCKKVCMHVGMYVCMLVRIYICVCMCECMNECINVCMYECMY
jgi:hypothetical protein